MFGALALVCGFAVFLLPETRATTLPDTIAEIEDKGHGAGIKHTPKEEKENMMVMSKCEG